LKPRGYKILLEVLGKGTWEKDKEIPFEFVDREIGSSKLKLKTIIEYAHQVIDITLFSFLHHQSAAWREWKKVFKFGLVGLSGIFVNMGILIFLKESAGLSIPVASLFAIEISILSNFLLNDVWTFRDSQNHKLSRWWQRLLSFQAVSVGGALINFVTLNVLTYIMGLDYRVANIIGILIAFGWNFILNRNITWMKSKV
jgi:dolichol-phosphate mannosyltransferase